MRPGMDKEFVTLCASYACVQISVDDRGGLNGSTQHRPEVQSADVSRLNSFESVDSKKTLPCLGLIEYSPKDHVSLKHNRVNRLEECCIDRLNRQGLSLAISFRD